MKWDMAGWHHDPEKHTIDPGDGEGSVVYQAMNQDTLAFTMYARGSRIGFRDGSQHTRVDILVRCVFYGLTGTLMALLLIFLAYTVGDSHGFSRHCPVERQAPRDMARRFVHSLYPEYPIRGVVCRNHDSESNCYIRAGNGTGVLSVTCYANGCELRGGSL